MENLFSKVSKLFKERGKSFDEFCEKMNTAGIHDIALLKTFEEFENRLKNGEVFADFKHLEAQFYTAARINQQNIWGIIDEYVPLITKTFKKGIF